MEIMVYKETCRDHVQFFLFLVKYLAFSLSALIKVYLC